MKSGFFFYKIIIKHPEKLHAFQLYGAFSNTYRIKLELNDMICFTFLRAGHAHKKKKHQNLTRHCTHELRINFDFNWFICKALNWKTAHIVKSRTLSQTKCLVIILLSTFIAFLMRKQWQLKSDCSIYIHICRPLSTPFNNIETECL